MSVREEDRQKNCRGRGLGIAAAAIGVGVGAALYYFFSKRTENPDAEGSTSNWTCEEPHALHATFNNTEDMDTSSESLDTSYDSTSSYQETTQNEDNTEYDSTEESSQSENSLNYDTIANTENSYMTISEHSTRDTSINETATDVELSQNYMNFDSPMEHITTPDRPLNDDDDDYIFERDTSYDSPSSYQETTQNEDNTEYDSTEESSQSENSFNYDTIANTENSYMTISEHSTRDTSINETATDVELSQNYMNFDSPMEHITTPDRPLNDDDDDYIFERDTSYDSTSSYQETTQNEDNTEYDSTEESSQSENSFNYDTIANTENSYMTISEHSTRDTSINETATDVELSQNDMDLDSPMEHITTPDRSLNDVDDDYIFERDTSYDSTSSYQETTQNEDNTEYDSTEESSQSENSFNYDTIANTENSYMTISEHSTRDTSINETATDVELSQNDIDLDSPMEHITTPDRLLNDDDDYIFERRLNVLRLIVNRVRDRSSTRRRPNRERSWAVEDCSICFESMQRNQEVMALPCTHRFHQACILTWLQERYTCPMCRMDA